MICDELESIFKETVVAQSKYCPGIFQDGLRKPTKTSVRIVDIPLDIRTEHLPNRSLDLEILSRYYFILRLATGWTTRRGGSSSPGRVKNFHFSI
jgi:hypothetical protein